MKNHTMCHILVMKREELIQFEKNFLEKVQKSDSCWNFKTGNVESGLEYGSFYCKLGIFPAHRFSFMIYKGEIPEGMFVCHNCPDGDNPSCVNPDHLFLGTPKENTNDFFNKKRNKKNKIKTNEHILRVRIPPVLHKKFKIICVQKDLSVPKQVAQLIRKFVEIDEENKRLMKHMSKE